MKEKKPKRESDYRVAWFCYWRIRELIESGRTQARIALDSKLTTAAISQLLNKVEGVGPTTVERLAPTLGYATRGALIDAADKWWTERGADYAVREGRRLADERAKKYGKPAQLANLRAQLEAEQKKSSAPASQKKHRRKAS